MAYKLLRGTGAHGLMPMFVQTVFAAIVDKQLFSVRDVAQGNDHGQVLSVESLPNLKRAVGTPRMIRKCSDAAETGRIDVFAGSEYAQGVGCREFAVPGVELCRIEGFPIVRAHHHVRMKDDGRVGRVSSYRKKTHSSSGNGRRFDLKAHDAPEMFPAILNTDDRCATAKGAVGLQGRTFQSAQSAFEVGTFRPLECEVTHT